MLKVNQVCASYVQVQVLREVSIEVKPAQNVAIIGANGVGKTTLLRTISGLNRVNSGEIIFMGKNITGMPPHERAKMGIVHVPEGRGILRTLTVLENIQLGANLGRRRDKVSRALDDFPDISNRKLMPAGILSGGQQQILAILRGLQANPRLLILDEPSLGLSPKAVKTVYHMLSDLAVKGDIGLLIVEQNIDMVLSVTDFAFLMEGGTVVMSGKSADMLSNPAVKAVYMGKHKVN